MGRGGRIGALRRLLLAIPILLAACQPAASPSPTPSVSVKPIAIPARYSPETAPREGGSASVGDWQLPAALPAIYAQPANAIWVEQALFSGLVGVDPALGYYGDLARDVPTVENGGVTTAGSGMDVTYTLRAGLHWSDGQPVTPGDVVFTWRASHGQEGYDRITGIDVAGDSLVMHFASIYPAYALLFGAIAPAHRLASVDPARLPADPYWKKPDVVSGPFTLADAPGDRYVLQRNPRYADGRPGAPLLGHLAHLERLTFQGYATKQEELAALKAGEIVAALDLNERDLATASTLGERLLAVPGLSYEQVTLNRADPLFRDDPQLVESLMLGVDRPGLLRDVLHGAVRSAESPISPDLGWVPQPPALRLDPVAAARELDADGWAAGPGGIRQRNGRSLAFTLVTTADNPLRASEAEVVAAGWRRLGADVRLQAAPPDALFGPSGATASGAYQAGLWAWNTTPDPDGLRGLFASGSPANSSRCSSPELDQALAAGATTLDRGRRSAAYGVFASAYQAARCETPLFWRLDVGLAARRLHNFAPNPSAAGNTWNVADWWVS